MHLTVFCLRRDRSELTFSLQVDADFELQNFRALCELESGIPAAESQIIYAEVPLTDNHRSLASYGLKDGDVVILQQVENAERRPPDQFPGLPRIDFSSITVPGTSAQAAQLPPEQPAPQPRPSPPEVPPSPQGMDNPALLRDMLLSNPHELSLLKERNPPLAEALLSGDLERFTRVLVEQQQDRARREQERIRLFAADPFDLEAQAKIEEDIRQQNIEENMTIAMEEAPESFGQVVMLYINCKVNGHPVKAFVDSGAQMTIMSQACAERCNIMRLVDRRWAGIAKGVGTQKIIGRVHLAQVQIEGDFLPCSFSILEEQPMDMLLGLDMLKRHQCSIDLKKNVLVIGTTGSQTTFLPEGELPECARLAYGAGREDVRPEEIADHELAEAIQKSVEEAENTEKETTSPEIPLLPNSDGFQHLVRFPEVGFKTSKSCSRPLNRSVSAPSLCSHKCGLAETVNPRAAKSVESLPECPAALGRTALPRTLLDLSDHRTLSDVDASLAGTESCCSPDDIPSPHTCAKPVISDNPEPPCAQGSGQGLKSPLEEVEGSIFPSAYTQAGGVAIPLSATGVPTSPAYGEKALDYFLPEGGRAEEGEFSCEGDQRPESELPGNETLMEMDQALLAANPLLLKEQDVCPSAVGSECSLMEAESSQSDVSLSIDSTSSLQQSGRAVLEATHRSATVRFSGSPPEGQQSRQEEEPCPSLTAALKELHQLLVVSYKKDFKPSENESIDQSETLPESKMAEEEILEEERECSALGIQDVPLSFAGTMPERVSPEASAGAGLWVAGAEEQQETLERPEQEALIIREPLDLNSSVVRRPSTAPQQPQCGEHSKAAPACLSSEQAAGTETVEQNRFASNFAQGDESSRVLNFPPRESGMLVSSRANVQSPPGGPSEMHICSPEINSVAPRPPVSLSGDIGQIVSAGFTPQEAGEALERAGGDVALALLLLLAKTIVVPP